MVGIYLLNCFFISSMMMKQTVECSWYENSGINKVNFDSLKKQKKSIKLSAILCSSLT